MWFNKNENKKLELKDEIKKLKQELKSIKREQKELEEAFDNKKIEVEELLKEEKQIHDSIKDKMKKDVFLNNFYEGNFNEYFDISLAKVYVFLEETHEGCPEYLKKYYLGFCLNFTNKSPYSIVSVKMYFNIENLFGDTLVQYMEVYTNKKVYPGNSAKLDTNSRLRWGTSYRDGSECFLKPFELENITREKDCLDSLVLKVKEVSLAVSVEGNVKVIDFFLDSNNKLCAKSKLNNKRNPQKTKITKKIDEKTTEIIPKVKKSISIQNIVLKNGDDINSKRLNTIKKLLNSKTSYVCSSYSPLKDGGVLFTNSYVLFILGYDYLPLNVMFDKSWKISDKNSYLKKYQNKIGNYINKEFPDMSKFIYSVESSIDTIEFDRQKILDNNKLKEKTMVFYTTKGYKITLSPELLTYVIKILNIEEENFTGYYYAEYKPIIIYNKDNELGLVLPMRNN